MSNVVIYASELPNRVTDYLRSVNTPDYSSNPNALINPDLSSVIGVDQKYWKVVDSDVVEMTADEKTALDNLLKAKTFRQKNYKISSYDTTNSLTKDTWYDTDNGDGTYSGKAEETTYTYQSGIALLYKIVDTYFYDETVASSIKYEYYINSQNQIIEKKVEE